MRYRITSLGILTALLLCGFRAAGYQVYLFSGSMGEDSGAQVFAREDIAYCRDHVDGVYINPNALMRMENAGVGAAEIQAYTGRMASLRERSWGVIPFVAERRPYSSMDTSSALDDWREFNQYDTEIFDWMDAGFTNPAIHFSYHHGAARLDLDLSDYNETLTPLEMESLETNINFEVTGSAFSQAAFTRRPGRLNDRFSEALADSHTVAGVYEWGGFGVYEATNDVNWRIYCTRLGEAVLDAFSESKAMVVLMPMDAGDPDADHCALVADMMSRLQGSIGQENLRSDDLIFVPAQYSGFNFFPEDRPETVSGLAKYMLQNRPAFEGYPVTGQVTVGLDDGWITSSSTGNAASPFVGGDRDVSWDISVTNQPALGAVGAEIMTVRMVSFYGDSSRPADTGGGNGLAVSGSTKSAWLDDQEGALFQFSFYADAAKVREITGVEVSLQALTARFAREGNVLDAYMASGRELSFSSTPPEDSSQLLLDGSPLTAGNDADSSDCQKTGITYATDGVLGVYNMPVTAPMTMDEAGALWVRRRNAGQANGAYQLVALELGFAEKSAPRPAVLVAGGSVADGVFELEISSAAPETSYPQGCTNLASGSWIDVKHSDDPGGPFVYSNLTYSASRASNTVIYIEADETCGFFRIRSE